MGLWKDLGLAQPGASLADAAADWMRGPPLTDCWRLDLCVPGRPKPPLCLAVSLSLSLYALVSMSLPLPLSIFLSVSSSSSSFSFSLYPAPSLLTSSPLTHKSTQSKNMLAADKHKKLCTQRIHWIQKWSASNVPKQMAETNFSLFADSCATSCNKKSMNQGQSIYSNNKGWEICHFPTPCFFFF